MMNVSEAKTALNDHLFDVDGFFAEAVTYNGAVIYGVVDYLNDPDDQMSGKRGATRAEAKLWVQVVDVAAPAYRDTVVIGSVTWKVRRVLSGDTDGAWVLELFKDEAPVI